MMHGHFQTLMTGPQRLVDIYFWSFGTWTIPTRFLEDLEWETCETRGSMGQPSPVLIPGTQYSKFSIANIAYIPLSFEPR